MFKARREHTANCNVVLAARSDTVDILLDEKNFQELKE